MKRQFRKHMMPTEQPSYARRSWRRGRLLLLAGGLIGTLSVVHGGCMPVLPAPVDVMQIDSGPDAAPPGVSDANT